jgi:uncharacterized protein
MPNVDKIVPQSPISSSPLRTWDFFETLLVALIAYGVFTATGEFALMLVFSSCAALLSPAQLDALWFGFLGRWQGIGLLAAALPTVAVLWVAIRMAGRGFAEYLALNWPSREAVLRAFGVMAILLSVESLLAYLLGMPLLVTDHALRRVGGPGGLFILLISGCITSPLVEEFVFRGFIFRGWSQSFLGPAGTIFLTSAAWGLTHTQYGWLGRSEVFLIGLLLGNFRWRSNSTWLTVVMHSTFNTAVLFTIGPYV